MDLSGRAPGYRGVAVRCPGCAEPMTPEALGESEVDVCPSCGGAWVDWFDGEVRRVATELLQGEVARMSRPAAPRSDLRNEAVATGACPRCTRQLVVERYALPAADRPGRDGAPSVSTVTGADLLRCEDCAGVFVPRTSATLLAMLPADAQPPPSSAAGRAEQGLPVLEPLPWQRFLAVVKRLLGV